MSAATLSPFGQQVRAGTYAGLFLITLSTLMYEIALTRIFSVTMWYHFAFAAISIALFGMTVGALVVYLLPAWFPQERVKQRLWVCALLFSLSMAGSFALQLQIPFQPHWDLAGVASVTSTYAVISVPFVFSGIVVCLALTRFPAAVNRLYGADLVGAALGCVLLVWLMDAVDGPSAIIAIAAIAGAGALLFALDDRRVPGTALALACCAGLAGFAALNAYLAEQRDPILRLVWVREQREKLHPYEEWNAFSRITVGGDPDQPLDISLSEACPPQTVNQLALVIDATAGTILTRYNGDPRSVAFLRCGHTNIAHYIRSPAKVAIIGTGGGRDVLAALAFGQPSITGIELNDAVIDAVNGEFGEFTGHLDRQPGVRFVNDEARSYLARSDERFDIIQIAFIDTWAATAAGAYALSENGLYTVEGWDTFLDRLEPNGVLSVSRFYSFLGEPPLEAYRLTAFGTKTLTKRGVDDPQRHMLMYEGPSGPYGVSTATMLISPQPFSEEDVRTIEREAARLRFKTVLTPEFARDERFTGLASASTVDDTVAAFEEDISAPTDDRPFFFQMANLETILSGTVFEDSYLVRPVRVLLVLSLAVLVLTGSCIVMPLLIAAKRSFRPSEGMPPLYVFFAAIGLGFLLVEIAQLQRLILYLGHPTYALSVVLFSLLLSSGIGSLLSERVTAGRGSASVIAPLAALLVVVGAAGFATPTLIDRFDAATMPARIALSAGLLMPMGLMMGFPFPVGMKLATARADAPTAFLWGINGAMSVCASVLGTAVALLFGISAAFWAGTACYVVAAGALVYVALQAPRPAPLVDGKAIAVTVNVS
jgi:hypothetical protein